MKKQSPRGFWFGFNTTAIVLIACFLFFIPILFAYEGFAHTVDIHLQKGASMGDNETAAVTLSNLKHTPLNAIEFELAYNPKEMTLIGITPTRALCEDRFIISNTINNASGTALFQCGTVTPLSDTHAEIATIEFIRNTKASTSLAFGTTTHVLAHDGFGTDATRLTTNLLLTSQ